MRLQGLSSRLPGIVLKAIEQKTLSSGFQATGIVLTLSNLNPTLTLRPHWHGIMKEIRIIGQGVLCMRLQGKGKAKLSPEQTENDWLCTIGLRCSWAALCMPGAQQGSRAGQVRSWKVGCLAPRGWALLGLTGHCHAWLRWAAPRGGPVCASEQPAGKLLGTCTDGE
jgi:hypothetical protein